MIYQLNKIKENIAIRFSEIKINPNVFNNMVKWVIYCFTKFP